MTGGNNLEKLLKYDIGKLPIEVPGGRNEEGLAGLLNTLGFKVGAEVGVESGRYSKILCEANPGVKLYCIDAWEAYRGYRDHVSQDKLDGLMADARARTAPYDVELIKGYSMDVVKQFEDNSLDFVYIDANHDFQNVTNDIVEWNKKVRKGGIIAGHDYRRTKGGAVNHTVDVVQAYTYAHGIKPWFVWRGDRASSWMWFK